MSRVVAQLAAVEGEDVRLRGLERLAQCRWRRTQRAGQLARADPQLVDLHAVEALGVLTQRGVAALADLGEDLAHGLDRRDFAVVGTRQARAQVAVRRGGRAG